MIDRFPVAPSPAPRRHRRLEERILLALPGLRLAISRRVLRRQPGGRLRRTLLRWAIRNAAEAATRGDYEVTFAMWHDEFEMTPPPEIEGLGGFPGHVRGREERIRLEATWRSDWGEFRYAPDEIVDLGDRVLMLGRMVGTGAASGAAFDTEWADLVTIRDAQVIREEVFFGHAAALAAAGVPPP